MVIYKDTYSERYDFFINIVTRCISVGSTRRVAYV